jgi:hypothetical protein
VGVKKGRRRGPGTGGGRDADVGTAKDEITHVAVLHRYLRHLARESGERGIGYAETPPTQDVSDPFQPRERRERRGWCTLTARKIRKGPGVPFWWRRERRLCESGQDVRRESAPARGAHEKKNVRVSSGRHRSTEERRTHISKSGRLWCSGLVLLFWSEKT